MDENLLAPRYQDAVASAIRNGSRAIGTEKGRCDGAAFEKVVAKEGDGR